MVITIKEIESQFDKWNKIIFNNELPRPTFEITQTKSFLGQFQWRIIGFDRVGYKIRISNFFDRPMELFIDTIVHEMLHYYIKYKGIKDTSSHGRIWKEKAAEISKKYGLHITRTSPTGGGVSEAVIEKKMNKKVAKFEYAIIAKMKDGRYGAAVIPSCKLYAFIPHYKNWNALESFKVIKAPWNQTYKLRHLRTACGIGYITKEQYNELLNNMVLEF